MELEDRFWWIEAGEIQDPRHSACVHVNVHARMSDYKKLKGYAWKWFRHACGQNDISSRDKIILWAITERHRAASFSCRDSFSYLGKMTGLSRGSVRKAIDSLQKHKYIWLVPEWERRVIRKSLGATRKHILLVGLGYLIEKEER